MHNPSGNVSITELDIKSEEDAKKYVTDLEQNAQEIEMYTTILNNYRAAGQGEPQWVLDKLEELGAPYGTVKKDSREEALPGYTDIKGVTIKNEEDAKKYVKQLEQNAKDIEMYTAILNNYRKSGQGEPQWVLDKLEALGAPYGIIEKNLTISYEQAKNAAYIADALIKEQYQPTLMETLEAIIRQQSPENLIENRIAELTGMGKQILYEVINNDPVISPIVHIKEYIDEFSFAISDWDGYVKREDEEFRKTVDFLIRNFTYGPRGVELTLEGELYYGQIIQDIFTEIYNDPKKFNELAGRGSVIAIETILTNQVFKAKSVTNRLDNIDDVNNLKKVSSSLNVELIDEVIDQGDLISVKLKDGKQFLCNKADIPVDELNLLKEKSNTLSGNWIKVNESMSDTSRVYQKQITGREGESFLQNGVKFDGMNNGILIEAKGNYKNFVNKKTGDFYDWFKGKDSLINQANRQIYASEGATINWYFSDEVSMNATKSLFQSEGITGINFIYEPLK